MGVGVGQSLGLEWVGYGGWSGSGMGVGVGRRWGLEWVGDGG